MYQFFSDFFFCAVLRSSMFVSTDAYFSNKCTFSDRRHWKIWCGNVVCPCKTSTEELAKNKLTWPGLASPFLFMNDKITAILLVPTSVVVQLGTQTHWQKLLFCIFSNFLKMCISKQIHLWSEKNQAKKAASWKCWTMGLFEELYLLLCQLGWARHFSRFRDLSVQCVFSETRQRRRRIGLFPVEAQKVTEFVSVK